MSSHYGLYILGYTCATLIIDNKLQWRELEQIYEKISQSELFFET